jgi:predicted metal-dependent enzyme (double-stranded beta helix superfamily)
MHVATTSAPVLKLEVLADIACGIAEVEPLWRAVAHHRADQRRPVRLLATDAYEVWVIGWTDGQGAEMHDHGDSAGVLVVLEGELTEVTGTPDGPRTLALVPGDVHALPNGHVHAISNQRPEPATSLHVYSPPLRTMRRYDAVTLALLDEEPVVVEAAALPPATAATLLHPAGRGRR